MKSNRIRILSELVAIDAWHKPIKIDGNKATVHVELTFKQGRIGGDDADFPFTFRISLKRALLTVSVEPQLDVDRESIARNVPEASVEHTRLRIAREKAAASLDAGMKLTPVHVSAQLAANAGISKDVAKEEQFKIVQNSPQTLVTYEPLSRTEYRWSLDPVFDNELNGQPWDAIMAPRLAIRPNGSNGKIEPSIKVELSCALEDLDITDIEPKKNPKFTDKIKEFVFHDTNKAAAVQHLKLVLQEADLEPGKLDNRFSQIMVASVIALED
jgi:hypothetical protein